MDNLPFETRHYEPTGSRQTRVYRSLGIVEITSRTDNELVLRSQSGTVTGAIACVLLGVYGTVWSLRGDNLEPLLIALPLLVLGLCFAYIIRYHTLVINKSEDCVSSQWQTWRTLWRTRVSKNRVTDVTGVALDWKPQQRGCFLVLRLTTKKRLEVGSVYLPSEGDVVSVMGQVDRLAQVARTLSDFLGVRMITSSELARYRPRRKAEQVVAWAKGSQSCPGCGGPLTLRKRGMREVVCSYCGATVQVNWRSKR